MRIEQLNLTAFGRFHARSLRLQPGLNLIYGQNEAGKSTIQRFILGMLYGFKKRTQRRDYSEDLEKYRPWEGDDYRGSLVYTLDRTGHSFRVERIFDPRREEVRVYDAVTGADLTAQFPTDRRKEILFAEEQFGLPEDVFRSTAWVGQMEISRVEVGKELVARVANLQESGREDLSVRQALRILEDRMREIGSDRAPTRPYARALRLLEEKRAELDRALQVRDQTMGWEAELAEVRAVLGEIDRELAELYRRFDWALLREAEARLNRVRRAAQSARAARERAESISGYATFPVHLSERIQRIQAEARSARLSAERQQGVLRDLSARTIALQEQLEGWSGMAAIGAEVAAVLSAISHLGRAASDQLPALRQEAERLRESLARVDEAMEPLRGAAGTGEQALARVESFEKELAGLRHQLDQLNADGLRAEVSRLERELSRRSGWAWLGLGLLGAAAATAIWFWGGAWGLPENLFWPSVGGAGALAALGLALFLAVRLGARRFYTELDEVRHDLQAEMQQTSQIHERMLFLDRERERILSGVGAVTAGEVRNRVLRYEQLLARREGQQLRLDAVNAEIARIQGSSAERREQLLRRAAEALGVPEAELQAESDPMARFQAAYEAYRVQRDELSSLHREQAEVARREREARKEEEDRLEELRAVLAEAGVESQEAFEAACRRREEWQAAISEAEALGRTVEALLAGETEEALERYVEHLRAGVDENDSPAPGESAQLQAEARRLEARRAELNARASDLAARTETALADLADIADLRREIDALEAELRAYNEELSALELARSTITAVAGEIHREFAPRLNRAMAGVVSALTGGKYRNVRIDESMVIRTITDAERTVDLLRLSGGTIDQFYFGLRVALLDLLTEGQEPIPLLLDDPFVQYDRHRHRAAMEYLAALSQSRQIIMMTCHQRELRNAQQTGQPVHLIDISEETAVEQA